MLNMFLTLGIECDFPIEEATSDELFGECRVVCNASCDAVASVRTLVSVYENERKVTLGGAWAMNSPPSKKKKKVKLTFNVFGDAYTQEAVEPDEIVGLIINKVDVIPGLDPVLVSISEISRHPVSLKMVGEIEKKSLYTETKR